MTVADAKGWAPPTFTPAFATDITMGSLLPNSQNDFNQGFSITRIMTALTDPVAVQAQQERNRNFNVMAELAYGGNQTFMDVALHNSTATWPSTTLQLTSHIEAYACVIWSIIGDTGLITRSYQEHLLDKRQPIQQYLETEFGRPEQAHQLRYVCAMILVVIFRTTHNEFTRLINGPVPLPGQLLPPREPPAYHRIYEAMMLGTIMNLTNLPANVASYQLAPPAQILPPARPPPRGGLPGPTLPGPRPPGPPAPVVPGPPAPPGGAGRLQVTNLTQNADLKAAWTASGHQAIFGDNAPFHDITSRNNRLVVPCQQVNGQRICLSMALRGQCYSNCTGFHGVLTPAEVAAVAQAGHIVM